jgi:hypothetical protein
LNYVTFSNLIRVFPYEEFHVAHRHHDSRYFAHGDGTNEYRTSQLSDDAMKLLIPEWTDGKWLKDISMLPHDRKVKSLIAKIREVYIANSTIS